ncbi:MAG: alkaline phosphatase D family protein [Planctomycetota bacterium]
MFLLTCLLPLLQAISPPSPVAFANGIKIGEVTSTSAILWTRLTLGTEAQNRVDEWDPAHPHWRAPHATGEVRFQVQREGEGPLEPASVTDWAVVGNEGDGCHQITVDGLQPGTRYAVRAEGRSQDPGPGGDRDQLSLFEGSFTTAPEPNSDTPVTFVISTCQDFPRRDDPQNGHRIYRSMLDLKPAFFVQTGDTLYYDKPNPLAKDVATARYKWNRLYALPNLRAFHARVPSYWMHDDHDVLKDDCWPGQSFGELRFEDGIRIWREQVPMSKKSYRTFRWGKHVQIWLPEGREYRAPNKTPDGPNKSILGAEQWRWLERSMRASDATFKFYVSATPVVGPDRRAKNDNHANSGFAHEGDRLRSFLSSTERLIVINGDRHWQYHSTDPKTGLQEFGCGPASDAHAGGFSKSKQPPWQTFLRIKGGFLSVNVDGKSARVQHHAVSGSVVHEVVISADD